MHRLFAASKEGYKLPAMERHRLEGFIECGVFLNLATRREMAQLMEQLHLEVFGKTIRERQADQSATWQYDLIDYRAYDRPTFERRSTG